MFTAILGYLASPIGKVIGIVGAVLTAVFLCWMTLKIHDAGIRRQALMEYNAKQLEQALHEQQEFIERQKALEEMNRQLMEEVKKQREADQEKLRALEEYLTSEEAKRADRESSEVLRETIRRLRGGK